MYLTKLDLSPQHRGIRYALGNCQQLHRLIMGLFGTDRKSADVLYRIRSQQGHLSLYLYSNAPICKESLLPGMTLSGERDLSIWLDQMQTGQVWHFDLLASPTKKVPKEGSKHSQRRILRTQEERFVWLQRKGEQNGFRVLDCSELEGNQLSGKHDAEKGGQMYVDSYHYQGILQIVDAELFRHAVQNGIGPGKAYGLGMLLLRR